jgi:signal transduction histidine kinase
MKRFNKDFRLNISIDKSLTDSDQMIVTGDEYLLKTALSNLVDNACKYSSDHSVDITLELFEKSLKVIFKDSGIGISEEDMEKIFEPFYRGTNAVAIPGSGIGLPLVKQIIKVHNGTLKIASRKGAGTVITVMLPLI